MAERQSRGDSWSDEQRWALGAADGLMVARPGGLPDEPGVRLHRDCWPDFARLATAAARHGFDLRVASGYRSFDRQLAIWNSKLSGRRPLLDDAGQPLLLGELSVAEQVHAVLRFSALPGASRHHWGSDFDLYDAASLPADYTLQLTPQEYCAGGAQAALGEWLAAELSPAAGQRPLAGLFYRPYSRELGAVAVEPWHLSHRALAAKMARINSPELLLRCLRGSQMVHRDYVLAQLPALWERYVQPYMSEAEDE